MGTGSSSKGIEEDDVRERLNSSDFEKISPQTSPQSSPPTKQPVDEMAYSGILVEKPSDEFSTISPTKAMDMLNAASFENDLTTPPVSNRTKNRKKDQPKPEATRRIVKATPPPKGSVGSKLDFSEPSTDAKSPEISNSKELASPIGANAANDILEESIEKNNPKKKNLDRVTNKQKSDREKLLQEKRRNQQPNANKVQANPFSRFLSAFRVAANPTHKRKESVDGDSSNDPNKRLKFGYDSAADTPDCPIDEANDDSPSTSSVLQTHMIAAAAAATVAAIAFVIVRGMKRK